MSRKYFSAPYDRAANEGNALEKLIGLGPKSMHKSYYPELKSKLDELTRFRNLLDNINDLIILIDVPTGEIIDVNKTTESLMELSSQKIIGEPLTCIMDSQDADKIYNFFRQRYINSKIFRASLTTSLKKVIPVEINCKIVRLKPNGYGVLIARNITDQEQARQEIELQRVFFRQLFDNSPKAIAMSDENFRVVDVNKAFTSLFGYPAGEIAGEDLNDLTVPEGFEHEKDQINNTVYQGRNISLQTRRKTRSGRIIDVDLLSIPVTHAGIFNGFFCTFTDITEKLQMERDIARQQKLESIALLAGGIAHDFNNILSVILANTSLSKIQTKENTRLLESLQRIENASIRAKDLTQQLLTFARGGEPIKKTFDLEKLLRETVSFASSGSSAKFVFDIQDDLMPVYADQGQISQIIQNLSINADQAMAHTGMLNIHASNITINENSGYALKPGQYVLIKFRDNGIGIRQDDLARVFDPYFTTKQKGSGLGLAIVYSIVKKHDGHISVESTPGEGTEFTILLEASHSPIEKTSTPVSHAKLPAKIMIMDDEQDILEVTAEYLEGLGYEVVTARDGHEALTEYDRAEKINKPIDLLVTDLTIPGGMGGKDLVSILRQDKSDLKAIVSSGYANDPIMSHYREHGFSERIVKPYRIEDLDELIQKCLSDNSR